jgi:SAM-dependent methyltransferase
VTFVNLNADVLAGVRGAVADGCRLPFRDGEFDVVFSNSVIEHVGDWYAQRRFAAECRRVGQRHYIQTPDWWFPIEPHLLTPFVHWFPAHVRRRLVPFALRALVDPGVREHPAEYSRIVLLTARQMETLFPDARIFHERFCGLSKSLIAIKL